MKKILLITMLTWAGSFLFTKVQSQCIVSDLAIELKTATTVPGGCEVVFDFSWTQEVNDGNKFAYVHLWLSNMYPALQANGLAYSPTSNFPTSEDLADVLATIVIDHNGSDKPAIGTIYHPQASVVVLSSGVGVVKENINANIERMTLRNITLIVPNCSGAGITGDIWASQADNGGSVHCVSSNVSIVVGNPRVAGLLYCEFPRQYSAQVQNIGFAPITVSYNVYVDEGDAIYEPASHDLKLTPVPVGPVTINPGDIYNSGIQSYLPYSVQWPYYNNGLWVEVTTTGIPNKTLYFIDNSCIVLPVSLTLFTARRDHSLVFLKWETASESDNRGYELQRRTGNGDFGAIAFIPSLGDGGNSSSQLTYNYSDINFEKGITEYRLKQIDNNGKARYSETRVVKGINQEGNILIYPNPSANGEVNIVFNEVGENYNACLVDMNGRVLRKWNKLSTTTLRMANLPPGMYSLQMTNARTNEVVTSRIMILDH